MPLAKCLCDYGNALLDFGIVYRHQGHRDPAKHQFEAEPTAGVSFPQDDPQRLNLKDGESGQEPLPISEKCYKSKQKAVLSCAGALQTGLCHLQRHSVLESVSY